MSALEPTTELLRALAGVMREAGRRWYVFGAQAAILWGRPRLSADVDVTVDLPLEDIQPFVRQMEGAGFRLRVEHDLLRFVERTRVLPFVHDPSHLPLDLILAGSGLEAAFLERAVETDRQGECIPVIRAEDFLVTKILAGRPKDLDDVRGVLAERGDRLDLASVRADLAALEEALDRSDLRPQLDQLLADTGR